MNKIQKSRQSFLFVLVILMGMLTATGVAATWHKETVNARWTGSVSKIVNVYYAPGAVYDYISILYEDDEGLKIAYKPTLGGSWVTELVDSYGLGYYSDMTTYNGNLYVIYAATDATETIHYLCYKKRDFGTNFTDGTWGSTEFVETVAPDYPSITLFEPSVWAIPSVVYGKGTNLQFAYRNGTGWHRDGLTSLTSVLLGNTQIAYKTSTLMQPTITYIDAGQLKYVVDTGLDGGTFTAETIDSGVSLRQCLFQESTGPAHVSYYYTHLGANDLKYGYRDGGTWTKEVVDSTGDVGSYNWIMSDQNSGEIDICYRDTTNGRLKYIVKNASWSSAEAVDTGSVGSYCSMSLYYSDGTNPGCPIIAYLDESNERVKFAYLVSAKISGYVEDKDTGSAISGAQVRLYEGTTYTGKYDSSDSSGYFEIDEIQVGNNYNLKVEKQAYYDWSSATITVRPGSQIDVGTIELQLIPVPDVDFHSYTIDDDNVDQSIGDNDGIPEAGETIEMYVNLRNTGTGTAHNVSATISTSDSYVTFTHNTSSSYGDIAPDQSRVNSNDFDFTIGENCPSGHVINFNLSIISSEGNWSDSFTVIVYVNEIIDIEYQSHTIDDDNYGESSGDSDATPEAGESIEMYVYLRNTGNTTAHNATATISTADPYITFLYNTSSSYGEIPAGESRANSNDFDFQISESCPNAHVVTFNLTITATEGNWTDLFTVTVYREGNPYLEYYSVRVDDDNSANSSGDNDEVPEPGETIELYVNLYNSGTLTAHNVSASISTSDPYITFLYNTSSSYGDIAPEAWSANSNDFDFRISSSCPAGHIILFNLYITATEGNWSDSFSLMVGRPTGAQDLIQMTPYGHVWVSLSDGTKFGTPQRWVSESGFIYDGINGWVTMMGDINGDGLNDLIEITPYAHVWVMLSNGSGFNVPVRWTTNGFIFDAGGFWIPSIGDVNGDGLSDLIETTPYGHIWVMLSTGSSFGEQQRWATNGFINDAANGWIINVGDFNGDNRSDLLQVTPFGHTWVSLSNGSGFNAPTKWTTSGFIFDSSTGWVPAVGDVNGDGREDMLQFTPFGHIWVALSTGNSFGAPTRWSTNGFIFDPVNGWLPSVADVNGDGLMDTLEFTPYGHVWVSLSDGASFGAPSLWGTPGFVYDGTTGWIPMVGNVGP